MTISIASMSDAEFDKFLADTTRASILLREQLEDFGISGTATDGVSRPNNRTLPPFAVSDSE